MRLLLDECVPRKLKNFPAGHDCQTVPETGLAGRKNGELLSLAEQAGFEVFLTLDQGFEYEQSLLGRKITIVVVRVRTSRMADLVPLVPEILAVLVPGTSGLLVRVGR
jgi:predicted nuclease of predicted toxin-antitoxin system